MALGTFIVKNLILIHKGTIALKTEATVVLAVSSSPLLVVLEGLVSWFYLNLIFLFFVFGAVITDHLVGSYVHLWVKNDFTLKQNVIGFFTKTTLVVLVYFLGEGIVFMLGSENIVGLYFRVLMRLMVFIYPAGSALVNISIVTKGKFPPLGFMNKIVRFNENLDLKEFKEE